MPLAWQVLKSYGYSGKPDLAKMVNAFYLQLAGLRLSVHFDYDMAVVIDAGHAFGACDCSASRRECTRQGCGACGAEYALGVLYEATNRRVQTKGPQLLTSQFACAMMSYQGTNGTRCTNGNGTRFGRRSVLPRVQPRAQTKMSHEPLCYA